VIYILFIYRGRPRWLRVLFLSFFTWSSPLARYFLILGCVVDIVKVEEELKYRVPGVMLIPRWVISQLPRGGSFVVANLNER
jgi:hypothetical protein